MTRRIEFSTPHSTMVPIGPYNHVARAGDLITIGAIAGVDPETGDLAGSDVAAQTLQIIAAFETMLASVGSDLAHVMHVTVFLRDMKHFEAMNAAYESGMRGHKPTRTAIAVTDLPKPGALVTMNLMAVAAQ